ncbi:hypothetical protein [Devosia sp.]|jgi:hypothetical protein|uniref:hypothetical protein n=1 Tax=Devosia sp. TaxID=1871048 RepID=UPI0037C032B0
MRLGLAVAALAALFVPSVSYAADRVCSSIQLLSPSQGQHFIGSRPIHFSWSGEPIGTVTRELHLAALDGSDVVIPLDGRFSDTVKVKMNGDLAWAVVFKDADGKVLCSSPFGLIAAGAGGGGQAAGTSAGSISGTVAGATPAAVPAGPPPDSRLVVGFTNNGRLVIVLQNTPYAGQYSKLVAADNYHMTNEDLMGATGVEFHGNNVRNVVTGSPGNDLIWLYDGNDQAEGGAGDDILVGGNGSDLLTDILPFGIDDTDILYSGLSAPPGIILNDLKTLDGDDNDISYFIPNTTGLPDPGDLVVFGGPEAP